MADLSLKNELFWLPKADSSLKVLTDELLQKHKPSLTKDKLKELIKY